MPKKVKSGKKNDDEEIIIGYNSKKQKDNLSKNNDKKGKKKRKKRKSKKTTPKKVSLKKEQKKKKRKSYIKKVLKILLKIGIVVGIAVGVILFLFVSPIFSIKEITVIGAKEINETIYIAMSGIEIGENIFEIDKLKIQSEIVNEAYVEGIEIKSVYPNKIEIIVTEREVSYVAEENERYFYLDKNGYILETRLSLIEFPLIKGLDSNLEEIDIGGRLVEKDLDKFNDIIKIIDAIKNNDIDTKLTSIDITNKDDYILEFVDEQKKVMLGDSLDLSAKMAWINLFIKEKKNEAGTIYLNAKDVYFAPNS